jgi:DNA polymerase phi
LDAPSEVEEVSSSDDESDSNSEAVDGDVAAAEDADAEAQAGLDEALAKVLGTRRGDEDLGQSDSSTDESDMDDDQMMEVDNHLVKIFTEKKKLAGKKQEKKEAKANVINLKRRVLDLLEIYLKQQHTNSLALETILPLLMLIRSTNDKGLSQKSCDVVRDFAKACKGQEVPTITDSKAGFDLLEAIHAEATKDASYAHVNACSSMSILVVKTLVAMDKKNIDGIVDLYGQTWKQWLLKKRCKVQASFFTSFVNWSTSASKQLQE